MPLTPLPGEGIELPLSEYNRLRAFQGGGWFWDHENQQVIREVLGDFLPRVEERTSGTRGGAVALFQHFVNGAEVSGKSTPAGVRMNRIPRAEYDRLQHALDTLKRKAEDPHTDPNARRVIEKFCLPDPLPNPELYRLHGPAWNRRLLVLWGCEHEQGTSLPPTAALGRISLEPSSALFLRRLPLWLLLLLLLLLLAFLGYHFWPAHREDSARDRTALAQNDVALPTSMGSQLPPAVGPAGTPDGSSPAGAASPASADADPNAGSSGDVNRSANGNPRSTGGGPVPSPNAASPSPAASTPDATGTGATDAASPGSASPGLTPTPGPAGTAAATAPTPADTPVGSPDGSPATAGNLPRDNRRADTPSARENRVTPSSHRQAGASPAPGVSTPAARQANLPTDPAASPGLPSPASSPLGESTPAPGASPAPATPPGTAPSLEILNAPTSSQPHDGKMDLVLVASAHEADGTPGSVEITQWSVDGVRQQDRAGRDATGNNLSLTLTPGQHKVSIAGTAHGLPVSAEAEVNVQIKSQGDVTVKSGAKK